MRSTAAERDAGHEVAVIAGSPYDSELGADLLRAEGIAASPFAMARSPDEQNSLQYEHPGALAASFHELLGGLRGRGVPLALLFCNSLSSVVGHADTAIPVVSPASVYRQVLPGLRSSLVLAGNAHALLGVERIARIASPSHRMLGVSDPALVHDIEYGEPETAFTDSSVPDVLRGAEKLGLDAVVLACTHFTAITSAISGVVDLPIVDIGTLLVKETVSHIRKGLINLTTP